MSARSFRRTSPHSAEELAPYAKIVDQKGFRKDIILRVLKTKAIEPADLAAVVGRGGLLVPIPSGVYRVNDRMLEDLYQGVQGEHASNLGGLIADEIARPLGRPAFIVDPVVVDELAGLGPPFGHPGDPAAQHLPRPEPQVHGPPGRPRTREWL